MVEAGPLGVEMATALAHRGVETHVIDDERLAARQVADAGHGRAGAGEPHGARVHLHFGTALQGFEGSGGKLRAVATGEGPIAADTA